MSSDEVRNIGRCGGSVIAETDGSGAANTTREYIWIPGAGYAGTSLPVATLENVWVPGVGLSGVTLTYYVHTDHLSRPVMMRMFELISGIPEIRAVSTPL